LTEQKWVVLPSHSLQSTSSPFRYLSQPSTLHSDSQPFSLPFFARLFLGFLSSSANHLRRQAKNFAAGLPSPDFPQGQGESLNVGRSTPASVVSLDARRVLGLEKFEIPVDAEKGEREVLESWNAKFQKV